MFAARRGIKSFFSMFFVALVTLLALYGHNVDAANCGLKACATPKANMINVHLVPHSHDDVGWLKTVDQYYYGANTKIQRAGVQYILDSVVDALLKDAKRKFIIVESAFFFKWWKEQSKDTQSKVHKLVENGQLEFTGGAWSMNDEAAVHYQSVIDQFSIGLKALKQTFGSCARPRIGWQIDPFGHSREMASIFAQMGYDGEFFARMDWLEKSLRFNYTAAEMIWKGSADLGERAEIFTGMLYNHYSAPPGFCFDTLCSDDPIVDTGYGKNVQQRVDAFIEYIRTLFTKYRSNNLMVPMGDDFNYENALINFKNMDKLIKYVNERQSVGTKINVFYSTPACYVNAVHQEKLTYPTKTQDFFPYSSDWHTYWTGYYSSRPTQKRFERKGNHFLQVTKQLTTIANLTGVGVENNLNQLREVMGVMQHHDAITGTEKQHVSNDYDRLLTDGLNAGQINARLALRKLTNWTNAEFDSCLQLNISVCEFTNKTADKLVVTLFNPLAHTVTEIVRIPVVQNTYLVKSADGKIIPHQLVPIPKSVLDLNFRLTPAKHELVFQVQVDKIAHFYINIGTQPKLYDAEIETNEISLPPLLNRLKSRMTVEPRADVVVSTKQIKLTFSDDGHLKNIEMNGVSENIRQDFFYYKGALGNNAEFKNRSSGAYIFRPNGTEILVGQKVNLTIIPGTIVKEVHQIFNEFISQVIRIYENSNQVEFEWLVGPIPINDTIGKEIITRISSNLTTKGEFLTDSNGREMLRRVRFEREYFKANFSESVSGNYYPITARMAIQDPSKRIALLTDRAQGCTSMKDGQMEIMLHRRLLHDDAFGVGEALNETAYGKGLIARGRYYLILNSVRNNPTVNERLAQQQILLPSWKFFSNSTKATSNKIAKLPNFSSLPRNIHLLTLEPYTEKERLLRFENFMDRNETKSITINIREIFDTLGGEEIYETTLDGNMNLGDMKRAKFIADGNKNPTVQYYTSINKPLKAKKKDSKSNFNITLDPMQIRTFILKWK